MEDPVFCGVDLAVPGSEVTVVSEGDRIFILPARQQGKSLAMLGANALMVGGDSLRLGDRFTVAVDEWPPGYWGERARRGMTPPSKKPTKARAAAKRARKARRITQANR